MAARVGRTERAAGSRGTGLPSRCSALKYSTASASAPALLTCRLSDVGSSPERDVMVPVAAAVVVVPVVAVSRESATDGAVADVTEPGPRLLPAAEARGVGKEAFSFSSALQIFCQANRRAEQSRRWRQLSRQQHAVCTTGQRGAYWRHTSAVLTPLPLNTHVRKQIHMRM